jgi:hypothetical protein
MKQMGQVTPLSQLTWNCVPLSRIRKQNLERYLSSIIYGRKEYDITVRAEVQSTFRDCTGLTINRQYGFLKFIISEFVFNISSI